MRFSIPFVVSTILATAAAVSVPESHVVHERRGSPGHTLDSRWVKRDRLEKHKVLHMKIGLKQQNLDKGPEWLLDV